MFDNYEELDSKNLIHIRIQMRNNKKCITIIEGFAEDLDFNKIITEFRKKMNTNGNIVNDNGKKIIQLHGDKRIEVATFMVKYKIAEKHNIRIHGA